MRRIMWRPIGEQHLPGPTQWCPKNNPVRMMLGALKAAADPIPLPVYPVKIEADGTVYTNFVKEEVAK